MQILPRAIAQTNTAQSGRSLKGAPSSASVAGELSATYASSTQSSSFADFMNIYSSLPPRQDATSGSSETGGLPATRETLTGSEGSQALRQELQERRTQLQPEDEQGSSPTLESLTAAADSARTADLNPEDLKAARNHRVEIDNQNIKMTREDLEAMRAGLKGYGLSQHEINEIESKISSEEGLTWGQFVRNLSEKMRAASTSTQISVTENQDLQSFFQKLGYSPTKAKAQIKALSQGQTASVLAGVQNALSTLPQDRSLALTEREMTTFLNVSLRSSGLSSGTDKQAASISSQLAQAVSQVAASGSLPKNVLQLLGQFKEEAAQQAQNQATKDFKLVKLVGDTLKKSADRDDLWTPVDPEAQTQKILLQANSGVSKEIKENAEAQRNALTAPKARKDNDAPAKQPQSQQQTQQQSKVQAVEAAAVKQPQETKAAVSQEEPLDLQNAKRPAAKAEVIAAHATEHAEIKADSSQNSGSENAWNEFFGKLSAEQNVTATRVDGSKTQSFALFDTAQTLNTTSVTEAAKNAVLTRAALNQLQNAVLSNQGQGRTQLTLQLKPENLGTLSVILQVKNKEVQAVIRAENQETGKMLAANLESLRQSLEEQGLKVARMEVQTGLSGNTGQDAWLGQENHNLAREQQEALTAMKMRWRIMTGDDTGLTQETVLAQQQSLQNESGLHLVA
ncbi:MAG TPA: hypothetical protein DD766_09275 [Desulfovibrio sp.]|nr:hypothetical protein [Desulfovibrio sp.]